MPSSTYSILSPNKNYDHNVADLFYNFLLILTATNLTVEAHKWMALVCLPLLQEKVSSHLDYDGILD